MSHMSPYISLLLMFSYNFHNICANLELLDFDNEQRYLVCLSGRVLNLWRIAKERQIKRSINDVMKYILFIIFLLVYGHVGFCH